MRDSIKNPNLIFKNGVFLFLRLLLVLAISFYTTRLTLSVLGDENYGINNVIGGVISMFSIISMPITSTFQRFFNVEFTKRKRPEGVVFNTSLRIVLVLSLIMVVLYETIGLYLVNNVLKYPEEKSIIVNIIFHISVVTSVFSLFILPYNALLFAKENMGIPATIEIITAIIKLIFLFIIPFVSIDVLISYTIVILLLYVIQFFYYSVYCRWKYRTIQVQKERDRILQKDIFKFAGWSSISAVAGIMITYLSNIFINVFGGVLYNTAYGISSQLSHAVSSFSSNVLKAVDPQITSSTVAEQDSYRNKLTLSTIKLTFLVTGLVYVFFCFYGQPLLEIWLGHVPEYVLGFCNITLLTVVFTSIILPLRTIILATGKIQKLFVGYGILCGCAIIIMYISLQLGMPAITVLYYILMVRVLYFVLAMIMVNKLTSLKIGLLLCNLGRMLFVLIVCLLCLVLAQKILQDSIWVMLIIMFAVTLVSIPLTFVLALNPEERNYLMTIIKKRTSKSKRYE